jgi:pilus assembly protein CpaF
MTGLFGRKSAAFLVETPPQPHSQPHLQPVPAMVEAPVPHDQSSPRARSLDGIRTEAMGRIDPAAVARLEPAALRPLLENLIDEIATESRFQLNSREQSQLANELVHDMLGFGPLEPLLEDDGITDIMVNGPNRVFVEQQGKLVLSGVRFRDPQHVLNIAQRIAGGIGRRIDESSPMVDARRTVAVSTSSCRHSHWTAPASRSGNSPAAGSNCRPWSDTAACRNRWRRRWRSSRAPGST